MTPEADAAARNTAKPAATALWKVAVCMLFVMCLTTYVYIAVYRLPQTNAIQQLLARLYAGPSTDDGNDAIARRNKILRLRERLGVGMDSLPTVRFQSTAAAAAARDDEGDDDNEAEMRARQHECLSVGLYVSPDDDYVDCRSYCGVSDGVDYRFYDQAGLILNGRMGRAGAYCVPTDAAACNSNTSIVLYTKHGWRCMPQSRAFGGQGGNMILVCDGSLLDRATGRVWRGHIDPTLSFESVDEKLPSFWPDDEHDGYRFVCPPGARDEIGNALIPAPFDRFILLRNTCASSIPRANTAAIRPNFESGECECSEKNSIAQYDERLQLCVPYEEAYRRDTMESLLNDPLDLGDRATPCVETWSTLSSVSAMVGDTWRGEDWRQQGMRPCGIDLADEDATGETYRPAVVRNHAFVFDRPVPSPYAMLTAADPVGS